jgi:hypothetical protein
LFLKDFVSRNHMNRMKGKDAILDEICRWWWIGHWYQVSPGFF